MKALTVEAGADAHISHGIDQEHPLERVPVAIVIATRALRVLVVDGHLGHLLADVAGEKYGTVTDEAIIEKTLREQQAQAVAASGMGPKIDYRPEDVIGQQSCQRVALSRCGNGIGQVVLDGDFDGVHALVEGNGKPSSMELSILGHNLNRPFWCRLRGVVEPFYPVGVVELQAGMAVPPIPAAMV